MHPSSQHMMKTGLVLTAGLATASAAYNFNPTPSSSISASSPTLISSNMTSVNKEPYQSDPSKYYLGYEEKDFAEPFAKYWNPAVVPISDEVQKGLSSSPWASGLVYEAHQAHELLTRPGYLELENGWSVSDIGTLMIAIRTDMGNVTGEELDWFFSWHLVQSARYKLWNPVAHQYAWRYPNTLDWANKTYAERYINTYSFIDEFIGNNASKLTVNFIHPSELDFDTAKFKEQGIETMVIANIHSGGHVTSGFDHQSYLCHQLRRKPNGETEMRSRFWMKQYTEQIAHDLMVHCNTEMTHLRSSLPSLFQEFKDTL